MDNILEVFVGIDEPNLIIPVILHSINESDSRFCTGCNKKISDSDYFITFTPWKYGVWLVLLDESIWFPSLNSNGIAKYCESCCKPDKGYDDIHFHISQIIPHLEFLENLLVLCQ